MKAIDIFVIVIVAVLFVFALRGAKKHKCGGNCGECSEHCSACGKRDKEKRQ